MSFDRALATEEIRHIVLAYPEASDTGDLPGVGKFMEGVRFGPLDVPEGDLPVRTAEEAATSYGRAVIYYGDGLSHAKHLITNIDVELAPDGDSAQATSAYVVLQARPELPLQFICTGGYQDTLEHTAEGRDPRQRREWMDLTGDMSFHVNHPENFHGR